MNNSINFPTKLLPEEAAKYLGVTSGTLGVWRCTKRYDLPYLKVGSKIFYRLEDLDDFLQSNLHNQKLCAGGK